MNAEICAFKGQTLRIECKLVEDNRPEVGKNVRYRGSLQNYLIDTVTEVILVDTGLPAGTPEETPDENAVAFTGHDISTYMEAFAASAPRTSSTRHSKHDERKSRPSGGKQRAVPARGPVFFIPVAYFQMRANWRI